MSSTKTTTTAKAQGVKEGTEKYSPTFRASTGTEGGSAHPENAPKPPKAKKEKVEKPFAKSQIEVDSSAYVKKHDKMPGTGKREKETLWKFDIGGKPFSMTTEFYRTARMAAVEKALEAKCSKIVVVA